MGVGGNGVHRDVIVIINTEHVPVLRQQRNIEIWSINTIIIRLVSVEMRRIFFKAAALKLTEGIELAQPFPITTKTFTQHRIIVHGNVSQKVDFIHHLLLLKEILVNMMLKHLLRPKR